MISNFNYNNCEYLIGLKPKYYNFILIIFIIFGGVIIVMNYVKANDIYYGKAYIECDKNCKLSLTLTIDQSNSFNNINFISINNNYYEMINYDISEIKYDVDEQINYQILTIYIKESNLINNTIQDIKIYYNEDTLFNKVLSIFLY